MTETYQALGYSFGVRSEDARFGRVVEQLYRACASQGPPETLYEVLHDGRDTSDRELIVDGSRVAGIGDPSWLLGYLMWHVNHQVISRSTAPYVLLHAAAATIDGRAVLLPGAPEAGKTTLVTGLVREGAGYLTDEAVAIDPDILKVIPYPKPLSLDRGSWELFPDLAPRGDLAVHCREQWRIPPEAIRSDAAAGPSRPGLIVFPAYVAGAETVVERLTGPEALLELLRSTFGFHEQPRRNLRLLARMLDDTPAYTVRSGTLADACQAVIELAASPPAGPQRRQEPNVLPSEIDGAFVPLQASDVVEVELDGEAVLYHEVANTVHVLSPTATLVWNLLDGKSAVRPIVADLSAAFAVPQDRMLEDVLSAVREFGRQGLLEGLDPDPETVAASALQEPEPGERP